MVVIKNLVITSTAYSSIGSDKIEKLGVGDTISTH